MQPPFSRDSIVTKNELSSFVYIIRSNTNTIQIGTHISTPTNHTIPHHHNGVKEEAVSTLIECQIPSYINGRRVASLGYRALSNLSALQVIYIPYTIEKCNGDFLNSNSNLKNIIFEENSRLRELSFYAFYSCSKLETIVFPKSLGSLTRYSFSKMDSLKTIYIQNFMIGQENIHLFDGTDTNKLKIYVPSNYGPDTFAGIKVLKTLSPYYPTRPITCVKKLFIPSFRPLFVYIRTCIS